MAHAVKDFGHLEGFNEECDMLISVNEQIDRIELLDDVAEAEYYCVVPVDMAGESEARLSLFRQPKGS